MMDTLLMNVAATIDSVQGLPGDDFMKWIITLGVGGVLAAFMFVFYRKDVKQFTELWQAQTKMLMDVVIANTASNQKLISLIESQERNFLRKEDIEALINRHTNSS